MTSHGHQGHHGHHGHYVDVGVDVCSSSSSSSEADPDDEWTWLHPEHHHYNGHMVPHRHFHGNYPQALSPHYGHGGRHITIPLPHSNSPHRNRARVRSLSPVYSTRRRGRSADWHWDFGGPSIREDVSTNIYSGGGRSTLPNLNVDIHNHNSDHDHDHSHSHSPRSGFNQGYHQPTYAPPAPGPSPFHYSGYTTSLSGSAADGRAIVHDRFNADHAERMNQHVCVHNGDGEWDDRWRHHRGPRDWYDDELKWRQNNELQHAQKIAVDDYVHQQHEAEDARKAAVRDVKLELKEHENEIEDAEGKAIRKYEDKLSERKKAADEALFKFREAEAKKAEELKLARDKWDMEQKKKAQEENDKKKAWELEQKRKEQEEKDKKKAWEAKALQDEQEEKEKQKRAKEKWEADEKKRKDDEKRKEDEIKAKLEADERKKKDEAQKKEAELKNKIKTEMLCTGLAPSTVDSIMEPKKPVPRIETFPGVERPSRRVEHTSWEYFEPWDHEGRRWIRVHRRYVAPDTLRLYDLPYGHDPDDQNYLIIHRDYDNPGIDLKILIEHTRRHSHREPDYNEYVIRTDHRGRKTIFHPRRRLSGPHFWG